MSEFKVGDKVKCLTNIHSYIEHGDTAIVTDVSGPNMALDCCVCHGYFPYSMRQFELAWQPEPGEKVEGRDNDEDSWCGEQIFIFIGMDEGAYIVRDEDDDYISWEQVRPIKKTHTITLEDGTKVELSEESYQSLKDGINN